MHFTVAIKGLLPQVTFWGASIFSDVTAEFSLWVRFPLD